MLHQFVLSFLLRATFSGFGSFRVTSSSAQASAAWVPSGPSMKSLPVAALRGEYSAAPGLDMMGFRPQSQAAVRTFLFFWHGDLQDSCALGKLFWILFPRESFILSAAGQDLGASCGSSRSLPRLSSGFGVDSSL